MSEERGAKTIRELVFVDVETTGLEGPDTRRDAVVEVAAARVNLATRRVVDSYSALIRPWGEQSSFCEVTPKEPWTVPDLGTTWRFGELHLDGGHFAGVDWSQAVDYREALDVIETRFLREGDTVAGANVSFDLDHLKRDFASDGGNWECDKANWRARPWPKLDYHRIDICSSGLYLVTAGLAESVSLKNLARWARADANYVQAHRAMRDVEDAIHVYFAMQDYFVGGAAARLDLEVVERACLAAKQIDTDICHRIADKIRDVGFDYSEVGDAEALLRKIAVYAEAFRGVRFDALLVALNLGSTERRF